MELGLTVISFILSCGICMILMPPFIKLMEKYRILDASGGRKIHSGYTAHMGGIIIFISFALSTVAMMFAFKPMDNMTLMIYMGIVLLGMLIVGIRDDMHNISPYSKLFFEIIIGILMAYAGVRLDDFGGFLGIHAIPLWLSYLITICFFIVVVNAYNLIDGIDGQAGMQAINVFFFCCLFYLSFVGEKSISSEIASPVFMYISSLTILGSLVGFLRFNWQKASIFMGDAGSLFIGTLITIFIIVSSKYAFLSNHDDIINNLNTHTFFGLKLKATLSPFLFLFYLPLADTLRVFVNRIIHNKSPFHADKTHIHHYFIRLGYSHQKCTLITFSISFCISIIGISLAFLFNDNICIPIIILSWFVYVQLLHQIIIKKINRITHS